MLGAHMQVDGQSFPDVEPLKMAFLKTPDI